MFLTKKRLAILAIIAANIIWGAAAPIFKWSLLDIPPFTFAFVRFLLATLLLFPFAYHKLHIRKSDILYLILISFFGFTINISCFLIAMTLTRSINAPIIASSGPVFLLIGSFLYLKERTKRKILLGTLVSLLGILIITVQPILQKGVDDSMFGNVLLIIATIASVIYTLMLKKIAGRYSTVTLTFWTFAISTFTFLPGMYYETHGFLQFAHFHTQGILGLLFGAVFSSIIGYLLFTYAIKYIQANEIGVFLYIDPVIAIIIAAPLLGEYITPVYLAGSLLVFTGIFVSEKRIHWHPLHKLLH